MKKLLVCGLLMWLSAGTLWAQCDPSNSISLKSNRPGIKRNWVYDFDKLARKYSTTPSNFSRLRSYFHGPNGPKECISLIDLQYLAKEVRLVLRDVPKKDTYYFYNSIVTVAKKNPPQKLYDSVSVIESKSVNLTALDSTINSNQSEQNEVSGSTWFWISSVLSITVLALGGLLLRTNFQIKKQKAQSRDTAHALQSDLEARFERLSKEKIDRLTVENRELKQTNDELLKDLDKLERINFLPVAQLHSNSNSTQRNEPPPLTQAELEKQKFKAEYEAYLKKVKKQK